MRLGAWTLACILAGCGFHAVDDDVHAVDGGVHDGADAGVDAGGGGPGAGDLAGVGDGGPSTAWVPPTFTETDLPTPVYLYAMWGSAPDDVYATGDFGLITHSDGDDRWSPSQTDMFDKAIQGITGGPGQVVAVAGDGAILTSGGDGKWDWNVPSTEPLHAVWIGAGEILAAGDFGTFVDIVGTAAPVVTHWPSLSNEALRAAWGGGGNVYLAGDDGNILRRDGGGAWRAAPLADKVTINAVWGAAADDVYLVGIGGAIYHSTGRDDWTRQPTPDAHELDGVYGTGAHDIWAVGDGGTVLHSTGDGTWTKVPMPAAAGNTLLSVWASGDDVYIGGAIGMILHGHR